MKVFKIGLRFLLIGFVAIFALGLGSKSFAADENSIEAPSLAAEKEILKISEKGIDPPVLHLKNADSSVFFVNNTKNSLVTLAVDFGNKRPHCASENMKWHKETGQLKSSDPIAPKDFALSCFPESGTYKITAYGVGNGKAPIFAEVVAP